jgi:hypothetical protein
MYPKMRWGLFFTSPYTAGMRRLANNANPAPNEKRARTKKMGHHALAIAEASSRMVEARPCVVILARWLSDSPDL